MTHNFEFPAMNFHYKFEINRLKFTQFGHLKDMNNEKGKMIIICLFIFRMLLLKILLKPWESVTDLPKTEDLRINAKWVASIIYEVSWDIMKANCAIQYNNQVQLSNEDKIK